MVFARTARLEGTGFNPLARFTLWAGCGGGQVGVAQGPMGPMHLELTDEDSAAPWLALGVASPREGQDTKLVYGSR